MLPSTLHIMRPMHLQSLKLLPLTVWETMHLQENTLFTRNVAQYPLHHVTYAAIKFEVATSNILGGDTFTRNMTDRLMQGWTTDRLWYEINIPFFYRKMQI